MSPNCLQRSINRVTAIIFVHVYVSPSAIEMFRDLKCVVWLPDPSPFIITNRFR